MSIRTDCRHYRIDRPCAPHKAHQIKCASCSWYDRVKRRVLLIKLGAMGDVLRTTSLIAPIRKDQAGTHLTWLVSPDNKEVLEGIGEIDRIWTLDAEILSQIQVERFDWVINLDLSPESLALASLSHAGKKSGFGLSKEGTAVALEPAAVDYLEMSHWDDLKKKNQKTYQQLMLDILGLPGPPGEIKVSIPTECKQAAERFARENGLKPDRATIGLNLGAAGRWRWKRWTAEGYLALAERLWREYQANIAILSGPQEEDLKRLWLQRCKVPLVDFGSHNSYHQFAALVDLCDLVVTGDTMALHLALGLGKKAVALFGPTSLAEVELYGRGRALQGNVPCLCCYLSNCEVHPSCMESLGADTVFEAVEEMLKSRPRAPFAAPTEN